MDKDYLQEALHTFNGGNWYGWKKFDAQGNKIPNNQRMCYECIKIIKDGVTMPSKAEVEAKIQELKDANAQKEIDKANAKQKLQNLGLTENELKTLGL